MNNIIEMSLKPLLELTKDYEWGNIIIGILFLSILKAIIKDNKIVLYVALAIVVSLIIPKIIHEFNTTESSTSTKIKPPFQSEENISFSKKEDIISHKKISLDKNISKSLSMTEAIYKYLSYQNSSEYDKSYEFTKKLDKTQSLASYKKYWQTKREQFILYKIDKENQTFQVIIDYAEENYTDELNMYDFNQHSDKKWYITKGTKIKKLKNFDRWKYSGFEKLNTLKDDSFIEKGTIYKLKPHTSSTLIKNLDTETEVKAYVDTTEGRFYISKWSFQQLINGKDFNWVYLKQ